jgi:hypothetical protein
MRKSAVPHQTKAIAIDRRDRGESFASRIVLWTGLFTLVLILVFSGLTPMLSGLSDPTIDTASAILFAPG